MSSEQPGAADEFIPKGNNASARCTGAGQRAGNCKEVARGCWDGYGQLSPGYVLQGAT